MEDKRTLAAFLLIGAILLVLPYYYEWMGLAPEERVSRPAPAEKRDDADRVGEEQAHGMELDEQAQEPDRGEEPGEGVRPGRGEEPVSGSVETGTPEFTAQDVVVRTPLQELVFSTRGGALTSCRLFEYRTVGGDAVQMMPAGARGLTLRLVEPGGTVSLDELEFVPDRRKLVIEEGGTGTLRLSASVPGGGRVTRILRFSGERYGFDLVIEYSGLGQDSELFMVWDGGVAVTEEDASTDLREARTITLFNESVEKLQVDGDDEAERWSEKGDVRWVGARSKYFLAAIVPGTVGERREVQLFGKGEGKGLLPAYRFEVGTRVGRDGRWESLVYAGPLDYDNLTNYGADLEKAIDFGWPVVRQISKLLLIIFKGMYGIIPNYGWIIVVFAVTIKILVYPLTHKTYESTAKMQKLQPKIAALREKYGNDQQRLSKETMRLYKEEGVNPLGGCLPMLLQMPIFFALYNLFGRTIELRHAPFVLWIQDLSVPDALSLGGMEVHVLPVLMGASMLVQQKMTMKDPKQAMLVYLMPAVMIFIFWRMSAGLVLYWTVFNLLTIAQQVLVSGARKEASAENA